MADRLAIVRSYGSKNGDHSICPSPAAGNPLKASMSAICTPVWPGRSNQQTGVPTNVLVLPEAVQPGLKLGSNFETGALPTLTTAGDLGPTYGAFDPTQRRRVQEDDAAADGRRSASATAASCSASSTPCAAGPTPPAAWESMDRSSSRPSTWSPAASSDAFDVSKEDPKTIEKLRHQQALPPGRGDQVVRHEVAPPICSASNCCSHGG